MATNYPGSIDSLTNPSAGDALTSPSHSAQHANANDAIEAIETELGVNPSGSDATVAARLAAIEAGTNLAAGAVSTSDLADGAVTAAKLGSDVRIGNLLTANVASGTDTLSDTTGFTAQTNCTVASSTAQALQGSRSLAITSISASSVLVLSPQVPVEPGATYAAAVAMRAEWGGKAASVDLAFYTSGGSFVSTTSGTAVTDGNTSWVWATVTGVAPATAGLVLAAVNVQTTDASDVHYADCWGIWRGAGGSWAMPGEVIANTGVRPNPSNTAEVQIWNDATATWITV